MLVILSGNEHKRDTISMKRIYFIAVIALLVGSPIRAQESGPDFEYVDERVPGGRLVGSAAAGVFANGLPLGMPPGPSNARMLSVPPDDTAGYLTWANVADINSDSQNRTEQLLANEEVQYLFDQVIQSYETALANSFDDDRSAKMVSVIADQLARQLLTHETAIYARFSDNGPVGGLVCDLGDDAAAVRNIVTGVVPMVGENLKATTQDGLTIYTPQGVPGPQIQFTVGNRYFIIGIGPNEVPAIIDRLKAREVAPWLTEARERVAIPRIANMTYVNIDQLAKAFNADIKVEKEVAALGDLLGESMACAAGLDADAVVVRSWFDVSDNLGARLKSIGGTISEDDLAKVASDGTVAAIIKLNPDALVDTAFGILDSLEPGAAAEIQRDFTRQFTFDFRKDIIAALGDTISISESPREGGRLFTGWTGVISIRDQSKLERVLAKLQQMLSDPDAPAEVKSRTYAGRTVSYLQFRGDAPPVTPAWCIDDGRLIFSAFPQGVFGYLSRPSKPASADVVKKLTEQKSSVYVQINEKSVAQHVYPLALMMQSFITTQLPPEVRSAITLDTAALPSLPAITDHLEDATITIGFSDGIQIIRHQTLPPSGLGIAIAVGSATGGLDDVMDEAMGGSNDKIALPDVADGADMAPVDSPVESPASETPSTDGSDKVASDKVAAPFTHFPTGPALTGLYLQQAMAAADDGQHAVAIARFQQILDKEPDSVAALNGLGKSQYAMRLYPATEKTFSKLVSVAPEFYGSYLGYGKALWVQDHNQESISQFQKALELNPKSAESWLFLGWAYDSLKQNEKSIEPFSKAIELDPSDWRPSYLRGLAYYQLKKNEAALTDFTTVAKQRPAYVRSRNFRAKTLLRLNRTDDAINEMDECIKLDPLNKDHLNQRAEMFKTAKKFAHAVRDYNALIGLNADDADAFKNRAGCWMDLEEYSNAIGDYTNGIKIEPDQWAYANRAVCWNEKGESAKVIADYTKALELDPNYLFALKRRASTYFDIKQYSKSKADYDLALEQDGAMGDEFLIGNFSWLLAACPDGSIRDGARALELATKAAELTQWKEGWVIDNVAAAHAELGDFDKALEFAMKAIQTAGSEAEREDIQTRVVLYKKKQPARLQ